MILKYFLAFDKLQLQDIVVYTWCHGNREQHVSPTDDGDDSEDTDDSGDSEDSEDTEDTDDEEEDGEEEEDEEEEEDGDSGKSQQCNNHVLQNIIL